MVCLWRFDPMLDEMGREERGTGTVNGVGFDPGPPGQARAEAPASTGRATPVT